MVFCPWGGYLNFAINGPGIGPKFFPRAPFSPTVGQWYHLGVTRNGNTYTLFIDGTPVKSEINNDVIPNPNAPLTIGQAEWLGFMNGRLDEVAIYNRALAEEEIRAIAEAGPEGKGKKMEPPAGWSMISLPVKSAVANVTTLFPNAVVVYKYQKGTGYVRVPGGENSVDVHCQPNRRWSQAAALMSSMVMRKALDINDFLDHNHWNGERDTGFCLVICLKGQNLRRAPRFPNREKNGTAFSFWVGYEANGVRI